MDHCTLTNYTCTHYLHKILKHAWRRHIQKLLYWYTKVVFPHSIPIQRSAGLVYRSCVPTIYNNSAQCWIGIQELCFHNIYQSSTVLDMYTGVVFPQFIAVQYCAQGIVYLNRKGNSATFLPYVCNAKQFLKSSFILLKIE